MTSFNEDRISSLPDGVLCHMLSFLPTKYSVRTSLLSTRWKHLFTFVPNLDFIYDSTNPDSIAASSTLSFIQFVSSVFIIYNVSRMNKFSLDIYHSGHPLTCYPIFSWISSAIRRQVQEIDIFFTLSEPMILPIDLFFSKTLTDLTLHGRFNIVLPSSSCCLPFLRTCCLVRVWFDDDSARRLFKSCPALEKLDLISFHMKEDAKVLNISSRSLQRFCIQVSRYHVKLVLDVPNLVYFEYDADGYAENDFSGLESLKSLVDSTIYYEQKTDIKDSVSVELVRGLSHVQRLCLYCGPMEAFWRSGHSLPTFNNLTRLTLGPMSKLSSKLLSDLLDHSPRLEFVSFNQRHADELNGADQTNYVLPEHVPMCVSLHLKEVEFISFSMLEYECKLIKYFLKNAKNLKKMHIQSNLRWDEQFEISSSVCQIVFDSQDIEEL